MKQHFFMVQFLIAVLAVAGITGCASTGAITTLQDPSIPWQEHALLLTAGYISSTTAVVTDLKMPIAVIGVRSVGIIPPGTQTIHVSYSVSTKSAFSTYEGVTSITFDFQPGERYVLNAELLEAGFFSGSTRVEIQTVEEYRPKYYKYYTESDKAFKEDIIDKFEKAEAWLRDNK